MRRSGFTLVETLIGVGLLSVAFLGLMSLSDLTSRGDTQGKASRISMGVRTLIDGSLKNPKAWADTVTHNTNLACASTAPGCDSGTYDLVIFGANGEKVTYDPADSTTRYTLNGDTCPAGTSDPNSNCPIKFKAHWKPICQVYPCLNPTLQIDADLTPEFGTFSYVTLNPRNYSFSTVRGLQEDDVKSACLILNGVYNVLTNTCRPKYAGQTCTSLGKPYQVVTDVHADGTITCASPFHGSCGAAQVMSGIDASGNPVCAPMVCPCRYTETWGACSASCGGGTQTSIITILSGPTSGGAACPSSSTQACNTQSCTWTLGAWSSCSNVCGGGTQTRTVSCNDPSTGTPLPDSSCPAPKPAVAQACNSLACDWSYSGWTACSAACGGGTQTRSASCFDPNSGSSVAPAYCTSAPTTSQSCNTGGCGTNCVASWSACSASCGGGSQTYHITTAGVAPGTVCSNAEGDTQSCNTAACACPLPHAGVGNCCGGTWSNRPPLTGGQAYTFCGCGNSPEWSLIRDSSGHAIPNGC